LGFFITWFLANNLLHFDNKTLALFDMSDPQISEIIIQEVYQVIKISAIKQHH